MGKAYDAHEYEYLWRTNYEARSAVVWFISAVASIFVGLSVDMPIQPFIYIAAIAVIMGFIKVPDAMKVYRSTNALRGKPLTFMSLTELEKQMSKNPEDLWLGFGFKWEKRHCQRLHEITKRDASDFVPDNKDSMGQTYIHGVEPEEQKLYQPLKHVEGHTLILGTTGSGKTRMFDSIITQSILRNETIIVIDPKGDKELRDNMRRACEHQGRPDRFIQFHPGFPEKSVRIDPLANFSRGTELASRIAALIQTSSGGEVFRDFGQMALNNVIQGLLLCDTRPSLVNLRRYLEGGSQSLIIRAVYNYVSQKSPELTTQLGGLISKLRDTNAPDQIVAKKVVQFYREKVQNSHGNSDLEGLLTMFEHDKSHFSKMVASLLPIMNMLTSGTLGPLLSPDPEDMDDPRMITDSGKMIDNNMVTYIGLDSLTDAMVGSAIGSIVLADLASVAGDRYNYGENIKPVNIFVDEAAEVINDPLIQILNKGRGAKLRLYVATQTISDIEARMGDESKAMQVLGNINNTLVLRINDMKSQEYVAENLPKTRVNYVMRTQGMSSNGEDPGLYGGQHGERLMEEEMALFPQEQLGSLPNLEFVAKISGGKVFKGRLPILVGES